MIELDIADNWLSAEQHEEVWNKTRYAKGWHFGQRSVSGGIGFWMLDLDDDPLFTDTLLKQIEKDTGKKFELQRVYANGQTHGLCGSLHQDVVDAPEGEYYTVLYYVNKIWNPVWGGNTVWFDKDNVEIRQVYPTPNTAVMFDSNILHAGIEPTRHCTELRVSVAWKLKVVKA